MCCYFEATENNCAIDQLKPGLKSMAQCFYFILFKGRVSNIPTCMRLGPALVWGSSMHRCLRRGGGSNRGGVNGLYLGVLLSYVVWELTG